LVFIELELDPGEVPPLMAILGGSKDPLVIKFDAAGVVIS
jgi:hypothetical protein